MIFVGFTHSAFALGYEAGINKSPIDGNLVPPGALVTFVQKGLQFLEMEANLSNVSMIVPFLVFIPLFAHTYVFLFSTLHDFGFMLINVRFKLARVTQIWMRTSHSYDP